MTSQPKNFKNIVILTGAGISAESGLRTFRDNDGLWEGHKVEEVATPEAFKKNPDLVHQFYNLRRQQLVNFAQPNKAHFALAQFTQEYTGSVTLITQNVDNLHEQGGSLEVLHMHGELLKIRCEYCNEVTTWESELHVTSQCPQCNTIGTLRPDIVWFGEMPFHMDTIEQQLCKSDLFISIGTSGQVYPAAGYVALAKQAGAHTVELNLESSHSYVFDEGHYGLATEIIPQYFLQSTQ